MLSKKDDPCEKLSPSDLIPADKLKRLSKKSLLVFINSPYFKKFKSVLYDRLSLTKLYYFDNLSFVY